ncbi:MAG: glutamate 5-kinase [Synechococcales cyanobacterium RM1_1_8]|nr:glutamate 5-kinase [Synechococcales cyanobacterium RM1_1_8]
MGRAVRSDAELPHLTTQSNLVTKPTPATKQTLVIKIGTSSLTQPSSGPEPGFLALSTIATLVETISQLQRQGHAVVLVTSGAVGVGCARLGLGDRPRSLDLKQAVAAVGQGRLMRIYDDLFNTFGLAIAQVLLTRGDFERRQSYVSVQRTFRKLLELGVIPVVNENDTVSYDELKFGDNDRLSAYVADLVGADWLFLLTDVDRLYSADPRSNPDAQPIIEVDSPEALAQLQVSTSGGGSGWGTGGMATKITAASIATQAGVCTVITQGRRPQDIPKILAGERLGTRFAPQPQAINARKRWIAHGAIPSGTLMLDGGAVGAIVERGKSLLAAGITAVLGEFQSEEALRLCDPAGREIGRGLTNYSHLELGQILGLQSHEIESVLGYAGAETVVHRDNLVLSEPGAGP